MAETHKIGPEMELARLLELRPKRLAALEGELANRIKYLNKQSARRKLLRREKAIAALEIALKDVQNIEKVAGPFSPELTVSSFEIAEFIADLERLYKVSADDAADWTKADGDPGGSNSDYRHTMQAYLAGLAEFMNTKLARRRKGYALVSGALSNDLNQGQTSFLYLPRSVEAVQAWSDMAQNSAKSEVRGWFEFGKSGRWIDRHMDVQVCCTAIDRKRAEADFQEFCRAVFPKLSLPQ